MADENSGFGDDAEEIDADPMMTRFFEELRSQGMSEEEAADVLVRMLPEPMERAGAVLLDTLKNDAAAMLEGRAPIRTRFQQGEGCSWWRRIARETVVPSSAQPHPEGRATRATLPRGHGSLS